MLIHPDTLAARLGGPALAIADASLHLPSAERDARADFETAHIPSARYLPLAELAEPDSPLPGKIPSPATFRHHLEARGIGDGSTVVLYDDSALRSACRAWFLFDLFGLEAQVLDCRLSAWRESGRATASGAWHGEAATLGPIAADRAKLRDKQEMLDNLTTHADQVVDARDAGRFTGETEDNVHNLPGGHIPGARNLPYTRLLREDGGFLPAPAIREAFLGAGIDPERPVVATCGSGVTASVLVFALKLIGAPHVALYDGSWSEWGADPDTPKERGPAA